MTRRLNGKKKLVFSLVPCHFKINEPVERKRIYCYICNIIIKLIFMFT